MDGKVLPERRYSNDWDGTWLSKTAKFDAGWSTEMYLPWSMMSLPAVQGKRDVGFAVSRIVSHLNERYQWPGLSQSSPKFVTALNTAQVDDVRPSKQFSIIPYASAIVDEARDDSEIRVGADLTWRPNPLFEVAAALNPDFGAVESDDVVLNLTALETFFPEKRLFFLEGNEVFETANRASFGNNMRIYNAENFATTSRRDFVTDDLPAPISLVNTRRIGGTASQAQLPSGFLALRGERDQPTDLLGAVKLTGNSGGFRYGALAVAEDDVEWRVLDSIGQERSYRDDGRDFAIARFLYEASAENRYSVGYIGTSVSGPLYDAQVHGIDAHFASPNGAVGADLQLMRSEVDEVTGEGALLDLSYRPNSNNRHTLRLDYFDEQVDINDLGFLARNDYAGAQYIYTYVRPKAGRWFKNKRGAVALTQRYNISKGQVVDSSIYWRATTTLPGRTTLRTALAYFPERFEDRDSRGNGAYRVRDRYFWNALVATDASKMFSYSAGIGGIQENLGDWSYRLKFGVTARPSPSVVASMDVTYVKRDGWVLYQGGNNFGAFSGTDWQPKLSLSWFVASAHQLKLSLQWAGVRVDEDRFFEVPAGDGRLVAVPQTQGGNDFSLSLLTTQLRYRWEIAPLTDLFVVYNRGNVLAGASEAGFSDLFTDAFDDPGYRFVYC